MPEPPLNVSFRFGSGWLRFDKERAGRRLRILIVEDEAKLAGQLATSLRYAGYAVDCAADGVRAHLLGHDEDYDAVVLDLGLPKMDGLAVLRQWRAEGVAMPVLILTARGTWHEKVTGMDSGGRLFG